MRVRLITSGDHLAEHAIILFRQCRYHRTSYRHIVIARLPILRSVICAVNAHTGTQCQIHQMIHIRIGKSERLGGTFQDQEMSHRSEEKGQRITFGSTHECNCFVIPRNESHALSISIIIRARSREDSSRATNSRSASRANPRDPFVDAWSTSSDDANTHGRCWQMETGNPTRRKITSLRLPR